MWYSQWYPMISIWYPMVSISEVEQCSREALEEVQRVQQAELLEVVEEAEQEHPQLAGRGCSQAAAQLRIPISTHSVLQGRTIAALVVCLKGHQPLQTASNICGVFLAAARPAIAAQTELVDQLLAMEGSLPAEQVEEMAAERRASHLLAEACALLDRRAARGSGALPPAGRGTSVSTKPSPAPAAGPALPAWRLTPGHVQAA